MEFYLMRHGWAMAHAEWDREDSSRPLSKEGIELLKNAVPKMKEAQFHPNVVVTSPYKRALQTAEIVAGAAEEPQPLVDPALASGTNNKSFREVLEAGQNKGPLLFVGHMPDISVFASYMTSDPFLLNDVQWEPGEIWALESGPLGDGWGEGKVLWKRKLSEW